MLWKPWGWMSQTIHMPQSSSSDNAKAPLMEVNNWEEQLVSFFSGHILQLLHFNSYSVYSKNLWSCNKGSKGSKRTTYPSFINMNRVVMAAIILLILFQVRFARSHQYVPAGAGPDDNKQLFFSSAPAGCTSEDIQKIFSQYGKVCLIAWLVSLTWILHFASWRTLILDHCFW